MISQAALANIRYDSLRLAHRIVCDAMAALAEVQRDLPLAQAQAGDAIDQIFYELDAIITEVNAVDTKIERALGNVR